MSQDHDRFILWYVEPLRVLEQLHEGQGGFVALATACVLYERYAKAVLSSQGQKADRPGLLVQMEADFGVDRATSEAFWDVMRDGLLHQGMPLQKKQGTELPKWAFHHSYPLMALEIIRGEKWLKVQPWKFMNRVIALWEANFVLLAQNNSFPWANIGSVPE
jgi:hypothetical protein